MQALLPSQAGCTRGTAVAQALAALRGLCLLVVLMEQAVAEHVPPLMVLLTAGVNRAATCLEMQMQVRCWPEVRWTSPPKQIDLLL